MPTVKGQRVIKWQRPEYVDSVDGFTAKLVGTGIYTQLISNKPKLNTTIPKVGRDYLVTKVTVSPGKTLDGVISVELESGSLQGVAEVEPVPVYEKDDGEETKPIEQSDKMIILRPDRPYYVSPDLAFHPTANDRFPDPEAAEDADSNGVAVAQRTLDQWSVLDSNDVQAGGLKWTLAQYKELKEAGRNEFSLSFPIARSTTYHLKRPSSSDVLWKRENPPSECGAPTSGWFYLKSKDSVIREGGQYRRIEEWMGRRNDGLENLIYP